MKKYYILFLFLLSSFVGFSQADCANAVSVVENTDYSKTLVPREYQWYKFTMPKDGKLQITWTNADNASIMLFSGTCGSLSDLGGGLGLISYLDGIEGEEYILRLATFGFSDEDITFSLEVNDVVQGDSCDDPIPAIEDSEGVNTIPPIKNQFIWFQFQMPAEEKILTISNPLNSRIEVYGENCTEFRAGNFFNQDKDLVTQNPRPNEVINIKFTLDGVGDADWTLSLNDFAAGENCDLAEVANVGTNAVPSSNAPFFWYTYTMPAEGGRLQITSAVDNNIHVIRNGCVERDFERSGNGNIFISSLDPNEEVLIRWNLSDGNDFDWNLSTAPFFDGDICSTAQTAVEGGNSLPEDDYADYWSSFTIPNNNATLAISPDGFFGTYQVYTGDCGNLTKQLDGFSDEEISGLSAGDEVFIKWNINETRSLSFDLEYSFEKDDQEITFNALSSKTFGDAAFDLTATASSGLDVSYTSSDLSVATVSGSTVTIVGAGSTVITAMQDGDTEYNAATPVEQTLTVNKADQSISFTEIDDKQINETFTLPASTTSGLTISYEVTGPADETGGTINLNGETGTVTVTASQAGNNNYNAALPVTQEFLVTDPNKDPQTISFDALAAKTFGAANFDLTASTNATGLTISYESSNTSVATVSGSTVTIVGSGSTTIKASQEGDGTYNPATPVEQTLTVNKASQTITVAAIADKEVPTAPFDVTASTTSGLVLTYALTGPATISGKTITLEGTAGTVTVTVAQAGNANYNAASKEVSFTVTNSRSDQTISITPIADKVTTDSPFEVEASSTSELALTYAVSGPATIDGTTITLEGTVGTVELTVSQAGNDSFNPATATASFEVSEPEADPCLDFAATATVTNSVCAGDDQGVIIVDPTAGTAPFTYSLDEADAVEENIFTTLAPGEYSVVVTDANGCTAAAIATINEPDAIEVTAEVANSSSILGNGSISLTVIGGTGEYTYSWSNQATTASIEELEVGEYTVTVTDENGCSVEESYTVGGVTANDAALRNAISIFPNPAREVIQIKHERAVQQLQLYDARGALVNEIAIEGSTTELNVAQLPSGLYFIKTDAADQLYRFVKD